MIYKIVFLKLIKLYPKQFSSNLISYLVLLKLPLYLRLFIFRLFIFIYKINIEEVELPLQNYLDLQSFFTRKLKSGSRLQDVATPGSINSPADGHLISYGRIKSNLAIQAKGLPYSIKELLKYDNNTKRFDGGHYLTIYLSPKDYHHIHVPFFGVVKSVSHIEGELWPVNNISTTGIPRLYERNRRAVWVANGINFNEGLELAVILIGAVHVGKIVINNNWLNQKLLPNNGMININYKTCLPGEHLGEFQLGSTVILLIGGPKAGLWNMRRAKGPIRVGEKIGDY